MVRLNVGHISTPFNNLTEVLGSSGKVSTRSALLKLENYRHNFLVFMRSLLFCNCQLAMFEECAARFKNSFDVPSCAAFRASKFSSVDKINMQFSVIRSNF